MSPIERLQSYTDRYDKLIARIDTDNRVWNTELLERCFHWECRARAAVEALKRIASKTDEDWPEHIASETLLKIYGKESP